MKKSSKAESKEPGKYAALIQQFKNLEREWKTSKKSRNYPRTSSLACSSDSSSILTSFDELVFENSPRGLMSCLQQRKSPNSLLKVKNCDMAVEEILSDRRAAIMSGKLKGRRLFQVAAAEDSDVGGGEISSDWLNMAQEREVIMINEKNICGGKRRSLGGIGGGEHNELSVSSCSFSDNSSLPDEKVVVVEEEKRVGDGQLSGGGGGYMVAMAWFAFVLILVTLGLISMSCNGKFVEENELILVPT